jgi:flagellar secretion chaperone FliS
MLPNAARMNQYVSSYKQQEILMASPEKCILYLYDHAIQSCANQQAEQARKSLTALIDALDFKAGGELAVKLFSLYEYCLRLVHQNKFDDPVTILRGLREAWQQAMTARHMAA